MPVDVKKMTVAKFPLRLMPSIRQSAEAWSVKEGVSLNQFINVAVAEKLAMMQQEDWLQSRKKPTPHDIEKAHRLLDKVARRQTEPGDELPEGFVSSRIRAGQRKKAS